MLKIFVELEKVADGLEVADFTKKAEKLGDIAPYEATLDYHELVKAEKVGPGGVPVPECFQRIKDAEIALVHYCNFSEEGMAQLPNLKIVSTMRAGTENFDLEAATKRGVAMVTCPGRNAEAVSYHAVGLLIAEVLNIARQYKDVMDGIWKHDYPTTTKTPLFLGKTVGIFGFGNIGRLTAQKLSGFHMRLIAYDPFVSAEDMKKCGVEKVDKDELFKQSKFVMIHSRLTPDTYHCIGSHELELMRPDSWLVNNARSGLIDTQALLDVLKNHKIAGAALDVFDEEPLPKNSEFLKLDNVTITPHFAGGAQEGLFYAMEMAVNGVKSILDGAPNFQVMNPEVTQTEEFKKWIEHANQKLGR